MKTRSKAALLAFALLASVPSTAFAQTTGPIPETIAVRKTGSFSATGNAVVTLTGHRSCAVTLTGTFVATVSFDIASDAALTYSTPLTATTTGSYIISTTSQRSFRVRVSAYTSGTVNYDLNCTDAPSAIAVTSIPSLPAGSNVVGKVGIDQTTPGTTNGVQLAAPVPAGTNNIGAVNVAGVGIGDSINCAAGSTNGTVAGTKPTGAVGIEIIVPAGNTITYVIRATAPGSAPTTGLITIPGPTSGPPTVQTHNLAGGEDVYVTTSTGTNTCRYL